MLLKTFRGVPIRHATGGYSSIPSRSYIDGGVANHPCRVALTFRIRQDLIDTHRIRLLVIEAVASVDDGEVTVYAKTVEHRATEVNRFVGQYGKPAVAQTVERFPNARIERGLIEHVRTIVRKEHLQCHLDISFR